MTALDAARRLADNWPAAATVSPDTGLPLCIETTRHVVEAFHAAGVPEVAPLPCAFFAYNREATAYVLAGSDGDPLEGSQRVEISPEAVKSQGGRGWAGHLVVEHPEFLLDLVLPGVFRSTAARGFESVTSFCAEKGNQIVEVDGSWMAMTVDGLCFRFEPRRRMASWRNTDAWRGPVDESVVADLARGIRELL